MNRERETAGAVLQKILDALGVDDININSRGLFEDWIVGVVATQHQPLLDAKDAEIVTLKALLEQAREGLEGVIRVADRATVEFDNAKQSLAAINAATGEK